MKFNKKYGSWAIIAGAAEGLGEAWSAALAKQGLNLIMLDNQEEALMRLSEKLRQDFAVETIPLLLDLKDPQAVEIIMDKIASVDCRLLIYNAAFSIIKPFITYTRQELDNFIEINARTQLFLLHSFSNHLIEKDTGGGIIMMSSLAGLLGMQWVAPYAATKAFAWNLAEALHHELKHHDIDIMACVAGATSTPAYLKTNPRYGRLKPKVMTPETVAESALNKLGSKTLFIPGFTNRLNYFILMRLLPRKLASGIANKTMRKMYQ